MKQRILLSGATGVIGDGLLATLLPDLPPEVEVVCLVRRPSAQADILARLPPGLAARVSFVTCDLATEGAEEAAVAALAPAGRCVGVHCAADVAWDKALAEVFDLNVLGSLRFARLLARTAREPQLVYVSSAFTALENWSYRNAYEESKAEGERRIRQDLPELPIATFSCSLVIGRQSDGAIHRFHGLYPMIKLMACMEPPFLVVDRTCRIDLIPVDWASAELAALVRRAMERPVSQPVVAAAGHNRINAAQMIEVIEGRLNAFRIENGLPPSRPVDLLPGRRWAFLRRSLEKWQPEGVSSRDFRYFEKLLQIYKPYVESDLVQAPCNTTSAAPDPVPLLGKSVDYWLALNRRLVMARSRALLPV